MPLTSQKFSGLGKFGLAWLLVNAAGWGVGFGLQLLFIHSTGLGSLLSSLVAAGVIGLAQWMALRWLLPRLRPISQGIAWVILTMFGYVAGFLVGSVISGLGAVDSSPTSLAAITFIAWGMVGFIAGLMQWMALLFFARGAAWWIGANALGYGLGAVLLSLVRVQGSNSPVAYGLAGLIVGATTLVAISRLRRPPLSSAEADHA